MDDRLVISAKYRLKTDWVCPGDRLQPRHARENVVVVCGEHRNPEVDERSGNGVVRVMTRGQSTRRRALSRPLDFAVD